MTSKLFTPIVLYLVSEWGGGGEWGRDSAMLLRKKLFRVSS